MKPMVGGDEWLEQFKVDEFETDDSGQSVIDGKIEIPFRLETTLEIAVPVSYKKIDLRKMSYSQFQSAVYFAVKNRLSDQPLSKAVSTEGIGSVSQGMQLRIEWPDDFDTLAEEHGFEWGDKVFDHE